LEEPGIAFLKAKYGFVKDFRQIMPSFDGSQLQQESHEIGSSPSIRILGGRGKFHEEEDPHDTIKRAGARADNSVSKSK
jgi:hypothetical protein